jgi:hypothetical protein
MCWKKVSGDFILAVMHRNSALKQSREKRVSACGKVFRHANGLLNVNPGSIYKKT